MKFTEILLLATSLTISLPAFADQYVGGYQRNDGTYVQPHHRSDPNNNSYDNWSSKGNTNPYTGERGTRDPNRQQNSY